MLKEVVPFRKVWLSEETTSPAKGAIASFITFLERKFGAEFIFDRNKLDQATSLTKYIHSYLRNTRTTRKGAPLVTLQDRVEEKRLGVKHIPLPTPKAPSVLFDEVLQECNPCDEYISECPLSLSEWGTLLGLGFGTQNKDADYPIEVYLVGAVLEGHAPGVFRYQSQTHALELIHDLPDSFAISEYIQTKTGPLSPTFLVCTSMWNRSQMRYGDIAYTYDFLEAGLLIKSLQLVATTLSLGSRHSFEFDDQKISGLLDLDDEKERSLCTLLIYPSQKPLS